MKRFVLCFLFLSGFIFLSFACSASQKENLDSLVEKGKLLVEKGTYEAGISVFQSVLTKDPQHPKALNALLSAYDAYAKKLSSEGRFEKAQAMVNEMEHVLQRLNAIPDLELSADERKSRSRMTREIAEAKLFLAPQNTSTEDANSIVALNSGREKFNDAVTHFKKRDYEIAQQLLNESIELDPANPFAYELLADISNFDHKLDDAERYYKKSFSINPDPRVRAKLEKLLREKKVDQTQQEYSDEHFIIRYRRSEHFEGSKIRQFLRDAYRDISQELGFYPRYKIAVTLYNREEYVELIGSVPHWSGALFDGKIRLPVYEGNTSAQELKKLIFHELTHAFVLDLSQSRCPLWLNEGLAQYQENKIVPIPDDVFNAVISEGAFISPNELLDYNLAEADNQMKAAAFYYESFSIASQLLTRYRWYHMKQLLTELGEGVKFEDAFERTFSRSFSDFGAEWKRETFDRYDKK